MRKLRVLIFLVLMMGSIFFHSAVYAQPELDANATQGYATCDLCGFCVSPGSTPDTWPTPPASWYTCQTCLYPSAHTPQDTLLIDPETHAAVEPQHGHFYTMLGCLSTNLNDFTKPGAAGNVIATLLQVVVSLSGGVAFLYLLYGSFIIATSQADPEKLNYGRRIIVGSIIGLLFAVFAVFIINLIGSGVLRIPGFNAGP